MPTQEQILAAQATLASADIEQESIVQDGQTPAESAPAPGDAVGQAPAESAPTPGDATPLDDQAEDAAEAALGFPSWAKEAV